MKQITFNHCMYGGSPECPFARVYHSRRIGSNSGCYCGKANRLLGELNLDGSFDIPDSCILEGGEAINAMYCPVCGKGFFGGYRYT
jgi:hypothetical protein